MADSKFIGSQFIGSQFAGLTDTEKQTYDALFAAFQQKQSEFRAARVALQNYAGTLRTKYDLLPHTPIATGDLSALRAAVVSSAENRQLEIDAALSNATEAERAKYAAWVAAGKPMRKIGPDTTT